MKSYACISESTNSEQVKEEIGNDPDFLKPYSVAKNAGGPVAPSQKAAPATATA